jgi:hypothetical protein
MERPTRPSSERCTAAGEKPQQRRHYAPFGGCGNPKKEPSGGRFSDTVTGLYFAAISATVVSSIRLLNDALWLRPPLRGLTSLRDVSLHHNEGG